MFRPPWTKAFRPKTGALGAILSGSWARVLGCGVRAQIKTTNYLGQSAFDLRQGSNMERRSFFRQATCRQDHLQNNQRRKSHRQPGCIRRDQRGKLNGRWHHRHNDVLTGEWRRFRSLPSPSWLWCHKTGGPSERLGRHAKSGGRDQRPLERNHQAPVIRHSVASTQTKFDVANRKFTTLCACHPDGSSSGGLVGAGHAS